MRHTICILTISLVLREAANASYIVDVIACRLPRRNGLQKIMNLLNWYRLN